jgi:hypothetical protein
MMEIATGSFSSLPLTLESKVTSPTKQVAGVNSMIELTIDVDTYLAQ